MGYLTPQQETAISRLEDEFPAWQFWIVHRSHGGPVWCARLRADENTVVNAYDESELAAAINSRSEK